MEPWLLILIALAGCGIALIASMVGIAGAILFLPLMILGFMLPANTSIGASTFAGAVSTTTGSIQYLAHKKVNFRLALIFIGLNMPGVWIGTWLASMLESRALAGYCGFIIIGLAIVILINRNGSKCDVDQITVSREDKGYALHDERSGVVVAQEPRLVFSNKFVTQSSAFSLLGGFVTGFGGMGGATVTTCAMLVVGAPMRAVVGASIFAAAVTYWSSAITRATMPGFDWALTAVLAIGAGIGAIIGAKYNDKVKISLLKRILSVIALFAGFQLILLLFGV